MSNGCITAPKGRGATSNPAGRFERYTAARCDDGWWQEIAPRLPATTVTRETCRSIITRNDSPDIAFDRSVNPYRGCEHGCIYCYARPSHANLGLSPGLDFETRLFAKDDAARVLERTLRRPGYRPAPIMLGANTDAYQPAERQRRITRQILEVLAAFGHPVAIATKSALIVRDLDLLAGLARRRLVSVGVSVTTLNEALARRLEPRAAAPRRRIAAIAALSEAGVPVSILAAPMIPRLNDHELEAILTAGAAAGAASANYTLVRLPRELKALFSDWLRAHVPDRAERVLGGIRACRGGALNDSSWQARMRGTGVHAALLAQRFAVACRRLGLAHLTPAAAALDCSQFRPPRADADQLSLF
jgi:DNA repair photolyase